MAEVQAARKIQAANRPPADPDATRPTGAPQVEAVACQAAQGKPKGAARNPLVQRPLRLRQLLQPTLERALRELAPLRRVEPVQPAPAALPRLDPNSAAIVAKTLGWGDHAYFWGGTAGSADDWSAAIYYSRPTDPLFEIHCWRYACPELEGRRIHIPQRAEPTHSLDGHMAVVDQAHFLEYDFSRAGHLPRGGGRLEIASGGATAIGTPGADGRSGDSTAAQLGLLGGMIRPAELEAGRIDHALITGVYCSGGSVWPAGANPGRLCSSLGIPDADAPKTGQHLYLAISDAEIDALPAPAWRKAILRAYAHYGAFVGDTTGPGGNLGIRAESTQSWLSFGYADPWVTLGERYGLPSWDAGGPCATSSTLAQASTGRAGCGCSILAFLAGRADWQIYMRALADLVRVLHNVETRYTCSRPRQSPAAAGG